MNSGAAQFFPLLLSLAGISIVSTGAAVVGKVASEQNSYILLGVSILIFSITSWLIFRIYQIFDTASFVSVNFYALLITAAMHQIASALLLNEPINWRGFAVIVISIALYSAALRDQRDLAQCHQSPHIQQESHHD